MTSSATWTSDSPLPAVKHLPASQHGAFQQVFEGIWFIQGGVRMPFWFPVSIGRSMTVVQNGNGTLTLVNSMRLTDEGLAELEALGQVTHVLRLAAFHGRDDAFYRERYGAEVLAIEGQRYTRGFSKEGAARPEFMRPDRWLKPTSPLPMKDAQLVVLQTSSPPEGLLLLEREGGILITGDSLQHTPKPNQFYNFMGRLMSKRMGFLKPYNVGPGWLQFASPQREEVRAIANLDFEHVLPGHGEAVVGDARNKYRPALEGDLKGCHQ